MLRKNWKIVFLIFLLMLYMVGCEMECYNPAGPDVPDPDIVKYFDFIVEYHRPAGSIIDPTTIDPCVVWYIITYSSGSQDLRNEIVLEKKGENLFIGELNQVACHSRNDNRVFDFYVPDRKRQLYLGLDIPVTVFGDILILENRQTGIKYQLANVLKLRNYYPYYGEESTMARCRIIHDGSVISKLSQLADVE